MLSVQEFVFHISVM